MALSLLQFDIRHVFPCHILQTGEEYQVWDLIQMSKNHLKLHYGCAAFPVIWTPGREKSVFPAIRLCLSSLPCVVYFSFNFLSEWTTDTNLYGRSALWCRISGMFFSWNFVNLQLFPSSLSFVITVSPQRV